MYVSCTWPWCFLFYVVPPTFGALQSLSNLDRFIDNPSIKKLGTNSTLWIDFHLLAYARRVMPRALLHLPNYITTEVITLMIRYSQSQLSGTLKLIPLPGTLTVSKPNNWEFCLDPTSVDGGVERAEVS